MRQVPIDECSAGPWLDVAVAEAIGLQVKWVASDPWGQSRPYYLAGYYKSRDEGWQEREDWRPVKQYSTDIAAAWFLIEEGDLLTQNFLTKNEDDRYVICPKHVGFPECYEGADKKVAPIIARAFLKAEGVEIDSLSAQQKKYLSSWKEGT